MSGRPFHVKTLQAMQSLSIALGTVSGSHENITISERNQSPVRMRCRGEAHKAFSLMYEKEKTDWSVEL